MTKEDLVKEFDRLIEAHYSEEIDSRDEWLREIIYLKDNVVKKLTIPDVVERSPIKMEVDFNGHVKFEIETTDFDMKFIKGVNGWGEAIPCSIVHKSTVQGYVLQRDAAMKRGDLKALNFRIMTNKIKNTNQRFSTNSPCFIGAVSKS